VAVGAGVGVVDGLMVGRGAFVTRATGDLVVGEMVGVILGAADGADVGGVEGVAVGGADGEGVGGADGEGDGWADGEAEYLQSFPSRTTKGPI